MGRLAGAWQTGEEDSGRYGTGGAL
ncbi:hypothetical protein BVIET440_20113 [Burkholderia vietnamiensis]